MCHFSPAFITLTLFQTLGTLKNKHIDNVVVILGLEALFF